MQESISAPQVGGIVRRTRFILAAMLLLEGAGALLLASRFCPEMGLRGIWYAVFHAISSFCNAGFDLMGAAGTPFVSLTGYVGDPLVNLTVPALFFLGYEFQLPQWDGLTLGEKILGSLFQAVTPRTAGYNTVDLTQLSGPTRMIITLLMLVGGAPGSTAGGFKVTTLAVFLLVTLGSYFLPVSPVIFVLVTALIGIAAKNWGVKK